MWCVSIPVKVTYTFADGAAAIVLKRKKKKTIVIFRKPRGSPGTKGNLLEPHLLFTSFRTAAASLQCVHNVTGSLDLRT